MVPTSPAPSSVPLEGALHSLRRSYIERLTAMGASFRELPRRLMEDESLASLKLCEAGDEFVRERAFEVFSQALSSGQEVAISQLQARLSESEAEASQLREALTAMQQQQRDGTDAPAVRAELHEVRTELETSHAEARWLHSALEEARAALRAEQQGSAARLERLEAEGERERQVAAQRTAVAEARAGALEEEARHWQAKCTPLRERCEELERELSEARRGQEAEREQAARDMAHRVAEREAWLAERAHAAEEREAIEAVAEEASALARDAEAEAMAARAQLDGMEEVASRDRAAREVADASSRWLQNSLSVVWTQVLDVVPMDHADAQALLRAGSAEELSQASAAFVDAVRSQVRGLEERLAAADAEVDSLRFKLEGAAAEVRVAQQAASTAAEHVHEMLDRTLAAERQSGARAVEAAREEAQREREAAVREVRNLRGELKAAHEASAAALAKIKAASEASLDERSQQYARDMRLLTESYREARDELTVQTKALQEARREKSDAERAMRAGLEEAARRVEQSEAKLRERSYLAAQVAGHASATLQTEVIGLFNLQDLVTKHSTAITSPAAGALTHTLGGALGAGAGAMPAEALMHNPAKAAAMASVWTPDAPSGAGKGGTGGTSGTAAGSPLLGSAGSSPRRPPVGGMHVPSITWPSTPPPNGQGAGPTSSRAS